MTKQEFVRIMYSTALLGQQQGLIFSIPVAVAQAAHESNFGRSTLARKGNNLFGVKATRTWRGPTLDLPTREYSKKLGWIHTVAHWRKYVSWLECLQDYCKILQLSWFKDALPYVKDPDKFLLNILMEPGEPGWATDPKYYDKVRAVGLACEALGRPKWEVEG